MSVYKKNNRWYYNFMQEGERKHGACVGCSEKKQAVEFENDVRRELMLQRRGYAPKIISKITLSSLMEKYLEYCKTNKKNYYNDKSACKKFLEFIGNKELSSIKFLDIEAYKTHRIDSGIKPSSFNREFNCISKMFTIAVNNEYLSENPCRKIKKLQADNIKIRFLEVKEQKKIFDQIKKIIKASEKNKKQKYELIKTIVTSALKTGMRKGEILNLMWDCVNFTQNYIEVLNSKSGKSRRIPLSQKLKKELLGLERASEFVFTNPETKTKFWDIKREFKEIVDLAEIKNFTFHDLRHTAATRMVENGTDLVVVQEILGHANIAMTLRYTHSTPERKVKAIDILDKY